ncbi:unnamed protein product [Blepharisma stoltei]|uniref:RING-type domain-containing protein n=1 Tax=Blepharisma stoltei TaxID=1481888 RepID=A0AAU9JH99_9CILI|nr:unnamed protein product [Blepharisma stoltei]
MFLVRVQIKNLMAKTFVTFNTRQNFKMVRRTLFLITWKAFLTYSCLCPSTYLGNGHCDSQCNVAACNYDQGDCDSDSSGSSDSNTIIATIVGVVVGIFVIFWLVIGCTIYCKYLHKKKNQVSCGIQNEIDGNSIRGSDIESSQLITKEIIQKISPIENYYVGIPMEGDPMCSVCYIDFKIGDWIRRTHCLHLFHAKCLDEWLLSRNLTPKCPTCERPFLE